MYEDKVLRNLVILFALVLLSILLIIKDRNDRENLRRIDYIEIQGSSLG